MACNGRTGEMAEVRRITGELCLEWSISRFLSLSGEGLDYYESPRFSFCDMCWNLRVYPNWMGWVSLSLRRDDAVASTANVNVAFGVRGSDGVQKRAEEERQIRSEGGWCEIKFCLRSELSRQLAPEDALTVTCEMRVPLSARDSSTQTDSNLEAEVFIGVKKSSEIQGIETLVEDFGRLLASGESSDISVQVGDTAFKAHRAILSARSPVLCAMFRHETAERATNKIIIEDCEADIFRMYLHYVYSGFVDLLTDQNVFGLYRVADKYLADNLKLQCLEHMQETLCDRTFCETVKLALTHGETDLLKLAVDFAAENIRSVVSTVEWQNFIREYPTEANEIFIKSLGPSCSCQKSKQ